MAFVHTIWQEKLQHVVIHWPEPYLLYTPYMILSTRYGNSPAKNIVYTLNTINTMFVHTGI